MQCGYALVENHTLFTVSQHSAPPFVLAPPFAIESAETFAI